MSAPKPPKTGAGFHMSGASAMRGWWRRIILQCALTEGLHADHRTIRTLHDAHSWKFRQFSMSLTLPNQLRLKQQHIARVAAAYSIHRPIIQRVLTSGFVLYVLSTTYQSLFSRSGPRTPSRGKGTDGKKPSRVAVRDNSCVLRAVYDDGTPPRTRWMPFSINACRTS